MEYHCESSECDSVTSAFNESVLNDMMEEVCRELERAADQYLHIKDKLRAINVRLDRARSSQRLAQQASLELQRDTTEGVMCVYSEYIQRKMQKLNSIQAYREKTCGY